MTEPQLLSAWAGHWTGDGTGVTVILPPPGTVGSGEVRGGAPATREFALLDPTRLVERVDAVVLVVNAWGDVLGEDGLPLFDGKVPAAPAASGELQNTTVGVVLTNARLTKPEG